VERLKAVRRYVESPTLTGAPFPPGPDLDTVPGPLYGRFRSNLDWWRQRRVDAFTDSAAELLLTERQLKFYRWGGLGGGGAAPGGVGGWGLRVEVAG
jgi:hypothetical protein